MTAQKTSVASDGFGVAHATFSIERVYPQNPARVFAAFAKTAAKRRWFVEGEGWEIFSYDLDFRVSGNEAARFRFGDGPEMTFQAHYHDIVPDRRIVYSYHMTVGAAPLSASLSTIELLADGSGTRLVFTEQDAFFDAKDSVKSREAGTRELLEKLGQDLARAS